MAILARKIQVFHVNNIIFLNWFSCFHLCFWSFWWFFPSTFTLEKIPRIELSFTTIQNRWQRQRSLSLTKKMICCRGFCGQKGAIYLRTNVVRSCHYKGCTFDFNWNFRFIFSRKVWKIKSQRKKFKWKTSLEIRLQICHFSHII